jgi:cytidine deaminase
MKSSKECAVNNIDDAMIEKLIAEAECAKEFAFVPWFGFRVGAAMLGKSGKIYRGANIEGSSFGVTVCAERTAIYKAITEGEKEFTAIAVISDSDEIIYPCGICRQVLSDFVGDDFQIICAGRGKNYLIKTFAELFPDGRIPIATKEKPPE